ncbi:MAG TPA: c-type cytochrome [Tahibacter sp.]|uniref:c-type cytochrome n=1 Tax=Tahibacter sp. TaxID=2056211 RepID=UPI002BF46217|nr:c-type cytochrome [Tahibacter sp.]HSX61971.1 c-type cytochrome [Tahibacter sp.]
MSRPVSAAAAALSPLVLVAVLASAATAQPPAKPARLGLCASCHGESGRALMKGTPHLAGQDLEYLKTALAAYRSGARDVAVMRAAVGALTPAELDELAAWYAAQPPAPP